MSAHSSASDLHKLDLAFARSRRRAAARHIESKRRWPLRRRVIGALVLSVALLSFATARAPVVPNAPAKSTAAKPARAASRTCGVPPVYAGAFRTAARETRLPLPLLAAVAWEESQMNPQALSGAGARGILQLMPATAKALATAPANPRANILAGARYLGQLVKRFDGNVDLALAAYNAGPTAVEKLGRAPSLETLRYAKDVEARAASLAAC
jgi:soluble lytic murein transglycosylase-like protein